MKKVLIGLLFVWIILFGIIGYKQISEQTNDGTMEQNVTGQTIIIQER